MTKPHGTGRNLVGGLIHSGRGSVPGLVIVKPEDTTMAKAKVDGVYTLRGGRFKIHKGDVIPDGAVLDEGARVSEGHELLPEVDSYPDGAEPIEEERAQLKAPKNKSKQAAPENRAKGKDA